MKNLFTSYTYTWQQVGIFKLALLSIGVVLGSQWHEFFSAYLTIIVIIALITTIYSMYISLNQ